MTDKVAVTQGLLPCPFCGGAALVLGRNAPEYWVSCPAIGCKASTEGFGSRARAIAVWNRRAPTAPTEPTVAFVQEWMMSGDHEPDQWHRDFAAAIDARAAAAAIRLQQGSEKP